MSDFKPYLAFRDHAAKVLGVKPEAVDGGARDPQTAATGAQTVGGAWSYTMTQHSDPTRDVRGWVTADAVVITADQNLGKLFEEAGVWAATPAKTAKDLAELIAWSFGMGYAVVYPGPIPPASPAPKLEVAADGAGKLTFLMSYRSPGPGGGAGGGPTDKYAMEVTLTADHQATLTKSPA